MQFSFFFAEMCLKKARSFTGLSGSANFMIYAKFMQIDIKSSFHFVLNCIFLILDMINWCEMKNNEE